MPYTFEYDQTLSIPTGTLKLDGVAQFDVAHEINQEMFGVLATPIHLAKLNNATATVDVPSRTVSFQNYNGTPKVFTAKTEDQRDELIALRDQYSQDLADGLGITLQRAQFFCGWFWRVFKTVAGLIQTGSLTVVQGPAGATGASGSSGAQGIQGIQGVQGVAGNTYLAVPFYSTTLTLTNMLLADTELPATHYRLNLDLGGFTQYRATLRVAVVGTAAADLRFQGSLDDSAFGNLDGSAGPEIGGLNSTGAKDTGWVTLAAQYRVANVRIRMMGKDGDGAADPVVRQIVLHFK